MLLPASRLPCPEAFALGSSLPSNTSQRPYHRLLLHSGGSSMLLPASRRPCRKLLQDSRRFPRTFLVAAESDVRQ